MNHKVLRECVREGKGREAMMAMLSTMSAVSKGVRKYVVLQQLYEPEPAGAKPARAGPGSSLS